MFAYLGCDDYCQLHEQMDEVTHVNDAIVPGGGRDVASLPPAVFRQIEKLDARFHAKVDLRGGVAAPVTSAPESALRLRPRRAVPSAQVTAS
jgi:hypothetical protein